MKSCFFVFDEAGRFSVVFESDIWTVAGVDGGGWIRLGIFLGYRFFLVT